MPITRREFTWMAGLTAAATALPGPAEAIAGNAAAQSGAPAGKRLGYCVVGLGRISVDHFLPGLQASQHARVTGLVSGHPEKAKQLAAKFGVPANAIYTYAEYDRIRDNPEIDAVYIGLPNSMHAEYTIRAAKVGKHVLCEKPMATSAKDAQAMIDACNAAKRKLMIAYRCQLEPTNLHAIEMIRSGAIGQVQLIQSANGFNIQPGEWRLNRELAGGGPLMDVGIYSINASRYLTGEEPSEIQASSFSDKNDPRFHEVEENVAWTMKFPSGIVASCITTYGADMDGFYRVHGSKGTLELQPAFAYQGIKLSAHLPNKPLMHDDERERDPAQFTRQADYFADCILHDKPVKMSGEEGARDMHWMAEIYKAAGLPYAQ